MFDPVARQSVRVVPSDEHASAAKAVLVRRIERLAQA